MSAAVQEIVVLATGGTIAMGSRAPVQKRRRSAGADVETVTARIFVFQKEELR
jgi:L-asparaginase/Glu-tRNA(Gln) amidotransferase subunit D